MHNVTRQVVLVIVVVIVYTVERYLFNVTVYGLASRTGT